MKKTLITICAVLIISMAMSQPAHAVMVPLVAGQDMLVGHVRVELDGDNLVVEYLLDEELYENCETSDFLEFKEIHLHVAWQPGLIPTNKKGLPEIGHFEYSDELNVIPLGDIPGTPDGEVSIAAHAVVVNESEFCGICDELVIGNIAELEISYPGPNGDSYFEITFGGKTYPVWCVDYDHSMSLGIGETAYPFDLYNVRTFSATCAPDFFPLSTDLTSGYGPLGGIDRPENLPLVVWILNQWRLKTLITATWNVTDIQRVVWYLMEDITPGEPPVPEIALENANQEAILAAAEAAEIGEPGCCDYVGVILAPSLPFPIDVEVFDEDIRQLAIMLVPAPCCMDETAWGLSGYPDARNGILFAPLNDKGKRSGSWAEHFEFPIPD